tara:strand:+ start:9657 stop:10049 length:393 start_codon:yes stop_codon:yes gene_type:complete
MQYQSNLLQSLGLQDILNMREREAIQSGQAIIQADMRRREDEAIKRQEEEQKKQRKAGIFTSILTLAGTIGGAVLGGPAGAGLGATVGKGLGGMLQPSSSTTKTTMQTPQMPMYQSYPYNQTQSRGGLYA